MPPKRIGVDEKAASYCSRRLRGLSPLPISPLARETRRTRASSLSILQTSVQAHQESPPVSPSSLRHSRRGSVIVHSRSNSGASTPRSGEWDNFTEQPSFWNSRFGWLNQPNRINIVSTESESSVEIDLGLAAEINRLVEDKEDQNKKMADEELSRQISALKKVYGSIKAELLLFTPDDLTEAATSLLPGHLDSVKTQFVSFSMAVDELEESYSAEVAVCQEWRIKLNTTRDNISNNRKLLMEKKQSFVQPLAPPQANLSTSSVESHMSMIKLNDEKAISEGIAKADDDYQEILTEIDSLEEDLKEHFESADTIKDKEDSLVRVAMSEVNDWKKRKQQIIKSYRKYGSLTDRLVRMLQTEIEAEEGRETAITELDSLKSDKEELEKRYEEMEEFVDTFIKELRSEDRIRSLHSRDTDKPADVEWPKFSGKDNEDFGKFKDKLERSFKLAKTSRDLKMDKLRSLLSGHAKDLVPDALKDLDEALKILNDAFGDPGRLVDFKLKSLADIGQLPSNEKKGGFRNQVSFYIKLQGIVEDIIDLGSKSDDLAVHAFHRSTSYALANKFPSGLRTKLIVKHSKLKGKAQLEAMLETIKKWRDEAQVMDSTEAEAGFKAPASITPTKDKGQKDLKVNIVAPYKFDGCLICKELQQYGNRHADLFLNHVGKFPTGCPKFLALSQADKFAIIKKVNICTACLNPASVEKPARHKPCKARNPFYCRGSKSCKFHVILCNKHQTENKPFLEKYAEMVAEKGVTFQIGVACPFPISSPTLSIQSARNVKKLNVGLDQNSKLLPVPAGNPMFMFCSVPGKTREVNIMLDSGCSHACLKYGAVVHQLNGFCTAKGEFPVNVAGGKQITAKGEWIVSLKKR